MKYLLALLATANAISCKRPCQQYRVEYNHASANRWPGRPAAVGLAVEVDTLQALDDSEAYAKAYIHRAIKLREYEHDLAEHDDTSFSIQFQVYRMDGVMVKPLRDKTLKLINESSELKDYK